MSRRRSAPRGLSLSRREVLAGASAAGTSGLLPKGWAGAAYASEAPEQPEVRIGIVAVESCASIVAAHEKGFFAKHGVKSALSLQNGWAAARDRLISGENHASHVKYAQPLASTLGLQGSPKIPMVAPFTLSRNGSVFMASNSMKGHLTFDPASWRALLDARKAKGETLTIALPLHFGFHGLMYRYFLANGGVNADRDFKLIVLPPAQMVQNIRVGAMDACAMVEPWGARGVADNTTYVVMYGHEMWPRHPVKSFGMRADWAERNPRTVQAMLRALQEAALWCDRPENRPELAKILSAPSYLNAPVKYVLPPLAGDLDWGDGRREAASKNAISFAADTTPQAREAKWFVSQFRRWGFIEGKPDYEGVTTAVTRPDLHRQAMRDLGLPEPEQDKSILTLWDGVAFDPARPEAYAASFKINNMKG
jgi:nitrate/nitrite transport system substrate-binding protein